MRGLRNGVAKQIQDAESRAIYTHCYGHALSLAASDTIRNCKPLKSALETTHEITKLVKYSPRRENLFHEIKDELAPDTPGIRVLCPTRWTVKADSMRSIVENYTVLNRLWDNACDILKDTETIARIRDVQAQMASFEFLFGLVLGEQLLRHTDNLSRTLQHRKFSAAEGQAVAAMTTTSLKSLRKDDHFNLFWEKVIQLAHTHVDDPKLPRKRRRPQRYEEGNAAADFHAEAKDFYRQIYYEALDLIVRAIEDRFAQPGYKVYQDLESLLLKVANKANYSDELSRVVSIYGSDINEANLQTQLQILGSTVKDKVSNVFDMKEYFQHLQAAERELLSEVKTVLQLILVMPATNAASERSFSAMRRVKSYLRSTMTQERLNHMMVLHVHKDMTDSLNLQQVANDFVAGREGRLRLFGKFEILTLMEENHVAS